MRYKVGDKVKVRSDLKENTRYGGQIFVRDMAVHCGKNVEISKVHDDAYCIKESDREWFWTDEMFEPVEEELTAEEAIKIQGEMCKSVMCKDCAIEKLRYDSYCNCAEYRSKNPDKVIEILKQFKKGHEKKEVEVTQKIYCLVMDEERRKVVHEEEIGNSDSCMDVLKNYCENHDGKFFSLMEFRYEVKQ